MTGDTGKMISSGNSGEYYVAAELERRGFSVAVPMSNVPTFDLLAIDRSNYSRQIAIQVKTNSNGKDYWVLGKKDEARSETNFFYVLVRLIDLNAPEYFIVPAAEVSKRISDYHTEWLSTPGRNGRAHVDNDLRTFRPAEGDELNYKDRWDLLK